MFKKIKKDRNKNINVKEQWKEISKINKKMLKNGSFSMISTLLVFAVIIVVNLVVGEIPEEYTQIDVSTQKLYTISDTTKEFLNNLDEDVTIYYIVQSGSEDDILEKMLTRYSEGSKHITVEKKDPVLYPNFVSQYTDSDVSENSLIVVHEDRSKVVDYSNLYESEMNYYTYSSTVTAFDGEGQIDSAISYVISDELPILYTVQGHGETTINSTLQESIEKANYEMQDLNLLTEDIPEDAACIMMLSPQTDISAEEAEKLIAYLENGGKALIITDYTTNSRDNLKSVMQNYGVTVEDGVVFEGDGHHYVMQIPYYLVPTIESTDFTSGLISDNRYILMPVAQAITTMDSYRDTLTIKPILSTSENAYIKENVENMQTYEKEDVDKEGEFQLGIAVTETVSDDKETQIIFYSSSSLIDESTDQQVSGGNSELILESLGWMCENDVPVVEAASKSLSIDYLTVPEYDAGYWAAVVCGIIPAAFIIFGFFVWLKRRKQ